MDQNGSNNETVTIFGGDVIERDCTSRCCSQTQAMQIVAAIICGTTSQVQSYCRYTCSNFGILVDKYGRTLLHIAASCGKTELLLWLLQNCQAAVDTKDKESGWTSLHRSLFYGQIAAARILLNYKASLKVVDHEGLTPLGIVMKDRLPYVEYRTSDPSEVYCWGSNSNYNLGTGNDLSRDSPELLEAFRRVNVSISKVILCKFHTVFLSNDGQLFTCGHGLGGRLGHTSELTVLTPERVRGLGGLRTVGVAAGPHHLVIVTDGGQIWTCGTNTYHQLGHLPPPESLLVPRPVSLKLLKGRTMIGCAAGKFHSVIYTREAVFTFGLNAGQLGHPKGDRTEILPRQVAALNNKDTKLTLVEASDGATVCATDKGDVYVLHEYQCRKIASRQLNLKKICVFGGRLDSKCDVTGIREEGAHELKVLLLNSFGKLFVWREEHPVLIRCLFAQTHQLILVDICLNSYSMALVTHEGAGYTGTFIQKNTAQEKKNQSTPPKISSTASSPSTLVPLLNREECEFLRVKRIANLHRASTIFCENKGRNFAAIQSHPKTHLTELPFVSASTMESDLKAFYETITLEDSLHDVVIKVGKINFVAHKFILSSRSDYFHKQLLKIGKEKLNEIIHLNMDFAKPDIFKYILQYIYCNTCDYLVEGKMLPNISKGSGNKNKENEKTTEHKRRKQGSQGPAKSAEHMAIVHSITELAKKFSLKAFAERLQRVSVIDNKVVAKGDVTLPNMNFEYGTFPDFHDVCLRSVDGVEFNCHRCVLIARLDYFNRMLNFGWIEFSVSEHISLPISSKVMTVLVEFLYRDSGALLYDSEDVEFMCQTLTMADQYLIPRLKEISEVALVDMITLKNVTELLELSYIFNATQLKKTCLQYICLNISTLLEMDCMEILNDEAMTDLTKTYRDLVPGMSNRFLTPYSCGPSMEQLETISKLYPVDPNREFSAEKEDRPKRRSRTQSRRISERETDDIKEIEKGVKRVESVTSYSKNVVNANNSKEIAQEWTRVNKTAKEATTPVTPTTSPIIPTTPISAKPKTTSSGGWSVPTSPTEVSEFPSLNQIMEAEAKISETRRIFSSPPKKSGGLSQKQKKALAKNSENTSPSLSNFLADKNNSPKTRENPWNIPKESSTSLTIVFGESVPAINQIIKEELEEEALIKQDTKSLNLIGIEELAIEELLAHYQESYPDERITVTRVAPGKTSVPHWRKL